MDKTAKGESMYNVDYFYNMLRMYSGTAERVCTARWKFVSEVKARTVLDFGSGCGFFKAFAPAGIEVDTFDLMPVPQTGITRDRYDLITLWDVLEHIPDLTSLKDVFIRTDHVAITVPIKPDGVKWNEYKHFKPGEHIHHFQEDYLDAVMDLFGFKCLYTGSPECPPREMIQSFMYRRNRMVTR